MITGIRLLILCFLVAAFSCSNHSGKKEDPSAEKIVCKELGLAFSIPPGFYPIDSAEHSRLDKKGRNAVKEELKTDSLVGWQPSCIYLKDSLGRMLTVTSISQKEAIATNGSTAAFIQNTFDQGNELLLLRIKRKIGAEPAYADVVQQQKIKIAGFNVEKNAFTWKQNGIILFYLRAYFFVKDKDLYMVSYLGSSTAKDNEAIEKAIENATSENRAD